MSTTSFILTLRGHWLTVLYLLYFKLVNTLTPSPPPPRRITRCIQGLRMKHYVHCSKHEHVNSLLFYIITTLFVDDWIQKACFLVFKCLLGCCSLHFEPQFIDFRSPQQHLSPIFDKLTLHSLIKMDIHLIQTFLGPHFLIQDSKCTRRH